MLLFEPFIEAKTTLFLTAMATARVNNSKPPKPKKTVNEESRAQNIKLFYYSHLQMLVISQFFVQSIPFQPSVMFVGKVRSLPYNGAPERYFNWVCSDITQKH